LPRTGHRPTASPPPLPQRQSQDRATVREARPENAPIKIARQWRRWGGHHSVPGHAAGPAVGPR